MLLARRAALGGGAPFTPAAAGTLLGWFSADVGTYQDAARSTAASANNDPVGGLLDQSGNARHGSQATSTKRPLLKTAVYNGKPCLRFDGADDILGFSWPPGNNATIVLVATPSSVASSYLMGGSSAAGGPAFISAYSSKAYEWYNDDLERKTVQTTASGLHIVTASQIDSGITGAIINTYYDGVLQTSDAPTVNINTRSFTTLGGTNSGIAPSGFDFCEALLYSPGLDVTGHNNLIAYLKSKWGIT